MQIVVIGLGYVGLPLAVELARHFDCVGLDIDATRIEQLSSYHDRTGEVDERALRSTRLSLAVRASDCPAADAYIITVPTPVDSWHRPDLRLVESATRMVAGMIEPERRPVIVYESTVYPGVTEEICGPLIEQTAGLVRGRDFVLGYSPERINPGDREHAIDRIVKVIAGETPEVTELLATVYGKVTRAGVFRAASIKAAEAAKVIENSQRDINIAFMNEVTRIFSRMGLSIWDVLDAANTKWNFLRFEPGLVGGHCIGVDPYYLSHRAHQLGHDPQVILSGRSINDTMGHWIANEIHERCGRRPASVLVLGLTFKEDVPDLRNSKVVDMIWALRGFGHPVTVHDPLADPLEAKHEYDLALGADALERTYDVVIGAVPHKSYREMDYAGLDRLVNEGGFVADIKRTWSEAVRAQLGDRLWTL